MGDTFTDHDVRLMIREALRRAGVEHFHAASPAQRAAVIDELVGFFRSQIEETPPELLEHVIEHTWPETSPAQRERKL